MVTNNAINLSSQGLAYYSGAGVFTAPSLTTNGVVYGITGNNISSTAVGATGTVLIGVTAAPPTFSNTGTTGTVLIGNTGSSPTFSNTVTSLTISSLTSTTATINNLNLTNPLPVSSGGTGTTTFTPYGVVVAGSTTTAPLSDIDLGAGQVLIGTSTSPVAASLTAGVGISITTGQGSITITNTEAGSGGVIWFDQATSFTATAGSGYFTSGATTTATLPTSPALGATVIIENVDATNNVTVKAPSGIPIRIGTSASSTTGGIVSTFQGDCVTLTYHDTDTTWYARAVQGNWTVN